MEIKKEQISGESFFIPTTICVWIIANEFYSTVRKTGVEVKDNLMAKIDVEHMIAYFKNMGIDED